MTQDKTNEVLFKSEYMKVTEAHGAGRVAVFVGRDVDDSTPTIVDAAELRNGLESYLQGENTDELPVQTVECGNCGDSFIARPKESFKRETQYDDMDSDVLVVRSNCRKCEIDNPLRALEVQEVDAKPSPN